MRRITHPALESSRVATGPWRSTPMDGNNGLFRVVRGNEIVRIIASDAVDTGWEHASVSIENAQRCPTWEEMCFVKDLFWDKEETVVQFHPPESEYVNYHPYCLHLWRCPQFSYPLPDSILVGPKGVTA